MRYCPYCHRFNLDRPQLCYYCGHSWHIRLCPRGHENPYDAQFCGTCGSADLTDPAGPKPWWVWLTKSALLGVLVFLVLSLAKGMSFPAKGVPLLVAICLLLCGYSLALAILPGPLKGWLQSFNKAVKKTLATILSWSWEKIKTVFT